MFMRAHLDDPGWFQTGSYAKFDRQARDLLDGQQRLFLIDDPARTDLAQYPPAFPALLALIYSVTGDRSAYSAQIVLWSFDLIVSFVLIAGIAVTAFGWRAGICGWVFRWRCRRYLRYMLRTRRLTRPRCGLCWQATGYCCWQRGGTVFGWRSRRVSR